MKIDAKDMACEQLNAAIKASADRKIEFTDVVGQRYIATACSDKEIEIHGTPGNAMGAYLDGATIALYGNAQEATGDTMNGGEIDVFGSAGDATGYAMRGGKIFIRGDVGYRCGIHMKAYRDNKPAIVIGGRAGSFLGEYQAGGTIVVLGDEIGDKPVVGYFCGTGMHGGEMYLRCDRIPVTLPPQVKAEQIDAIPSDVKALVERWCKLFDKDVKTYTGAKFFKLTPDSENPYKRMYTSN